MTRKVVRDDQDEKWDEMSWYEMVLEMVLARHVPEPKWYPAGLFGACISQVRNKTDPVYVLLAVVSKTKIKKHRKKLSGSPLNSLSNSLICVHCVFTIGAYCILDTFEGPY